MCVLFGLFCCSDTNTGLPCRTYVIGGNHLFPPTAAPQEPMVSLPFRPPSLNRQYSHTALYPSVPPNLSNLPSLTLQAIFEPIRQVLWDSPVYFIRLPSPPSHFSNLHNKRCETVLAFINRLPATPIHFQTDTLSAVIQSRIFHHMTCPSKLFLNRYDKRFGYRIAIYVGNK